MSERESAIATTVNRDSLNRRYLDLLHASSLWSQPLDQAFTEVLRAVSTALQADRVSIWAYSDDRRSLTLQLLYDRQSPSFSSGQELFQDRLPIYFEQLAHGRMIDIADLRRDTRAAELLDDYTLPLKLGALLDVTLRLGGKVWGVLCIEHRGNPRIWSEPEKNFAMSVADLLSQVIAHDTLRSNEFQLRLMADNLPIGLLRIDDQQRCLYVNDNWCELFGCNNTAVYADWIAVLPLENRAEIVACQQHAMTVQESFRNTLMYATACNRCGCRACGCRFMVATVFHTAHSVCFLMSRAKHWQRNDCAMSPR